jgi:hypothetical protein
MGPEATGLQKRMACWRARRKIRQNGEEKRRKKKRNKFVYHKKNGMLACAPKNPAKW